MDSDASARTPVADSETVSGFQVGIVIVGISITLPLLYSAGELARGIGLSQAIIAAVAGALILSLMSVPAAVVGARTRLSSYMIVEHTFGFVGAKFVNFWFGLFLLGWYAVTAELFGRTLFLAAGEFTELASPEWVYTVISSAVITVTTIYGFKAIDRLAVIAVPFLLLALVAVVVFSLRETSFSDLLTIESGDMTMPTAISAVVGAAIVGVVLMPDLTRYTRNTWDCVTASFIGQVRPQHHTDDRRTNDGRGSRRADAPVELHDRRAYLWFRRRKICQLLVWSVPARLVRGHCGAFRAHAFSCGR